MGEPMIICLHALFSTESCHRFLSRWTRLDKVSTILAAHPHLPRQIEGKNRIHVLLNSIDKLAQQIDTTVLKLLWL